MPGRTLAGVVLAGALVALVGTRDAADAPSPARAAAATKSVGCANRSIANFPGAYRNARNLVVGPLALVGARAMADEPEDSLRKIGWSKHPLLLRAGRRVVVRIGATARAHARLVYGSHREGEPELQDLPSAIRFTACRRGQRSGSRSDGRPVTFWSGGFEFGEKIPLCVPLRIVVDGGKPRRRTVSLGAGKC